jgi:transcriptional regulator with XRE-family HTH domain
MARNIFGETQLRRIREKRRRDNDRFTLRQFAKAVGVSPTYLSKVEKGNFPPPSEERIISIAKGLGEDPDKL